MLAGEFCEDANERNEEDEDEEEECSNASDNEQSVDEIDASESEECDTDEPDDIEGCTDIYEPEAGWEIVPRYEFKSSKDVVNSYFAYKFTTGWERGRVTGIEKRKDSPDFGLFIVKFISEDRKRCLALEPSDYDADDIWVSIKRKKK